jgi:hypothetical protein
VPPDILEIQDAVGQYLLGAHVTLSVYEWVSDQGIQSCPQVTMKMPMGSDQIYSYHIAFKPEEWQSGEVTAEFIARFFRNKAWFL